MSVRRIRARSRAGLLATALGLVALLPAFSAQAADVYVVHGIPGDDLGLPTALPVDIEVDGSCDLTAVGYPTATGPVTLETGPHEVSVYLSDGACGGTLAITGMFDFAVGETAVLVAHLDANGTATLSKFTVDASALADGRTRVSVVHAAAAPEVEVKLANQDKGKQKAKTEDLRNGDQSFPAELKDGLYKVRVAATSGGTVAVLKDIPLDGNHVAFAVGSLKNETFNAILLTIGAGPT